MSEDRFDWFGFILCAAGMLFVFIIGIIYN